MSKIIVLSQARINSKRLPSKVLIKFNDKHNCITLLKERVSKSFKINDHIFIVPDTDISLIEFLKKNNISFEKGSENDLISRHLKAARKKDADIIVRITSDCPLVDPLEIDKAVELYLSDSDSKFLYLSNHTPPENSTYPNGSDIEIFSTKCLEYINLKYLDKLDREHVTFPMWDGRENKKVKHIKMNRSVDSSWGSKKIRLTIDNPEDLEMLKELAKTIDVEKSSLKQIEQKYIALDLYKLNAHFDAREGWK